MELETVHNKIYDIRGQKVMLDYDLASLYEVETKRVKEAVRRNSHRFPNDFMFELTKEEYLGLRSQFATSNRGGTRYMPFAFTEQGVAMLSSVLNSEKAIQVNIAIIRIFVAIRQYALNYKELALRIDEIESQFPEIYKTLGYLVKKDTIAIETAERKKIGYKESD